MTTWAPTPDALDAAIWSFIDPGFEQKPAPGETPQALKVSSAEIAEPSGTLRLMDLCLQHVLIREVVQEESASTAEKKTARSRTHTDPSDAVLVAQALQGVPGAFNVLVERYSSQIFGVAYSQLKDREAAEDVAQDAFLEAAKTLSSLRVYDKFGHWVYGIARRKAIYVLRRRKMHRNAVEIKKEEERMLAGPDAPGVPMESEERNQQIRNLLNQLPEIYREILILKYIDDRSYEEIAELLGISLAAVDKRLMRAKEMLREPLRKWVDP